MLNIFISQKKISRVIFKNPKRHHNLFQSSKIFYSMNLVIDINFLKNAKYQHKHQENLVLLEIRNKVKQEMS